MHGTGGTTLAAGMTKSPIMTLENAVGFFLLGTLMRILPWVAPGSMGARAIDGQSTGALWLEFMGILLLVLGGTHLLRPLFSATWMQLKRLAAAVLQPAAKPVQGMLGEKV